jgi:hypothetical protein
MSCFHASSLKVRSNEALFRFIRRRFGGRVTFRRRDSDIFLWLAAGGFCSYSLNRFWYRRIDGDHGVRRRCRFWAYGGLNFRHRFWRGNGFSGRLDGDLWCWLRDDDRCWLGFWNWLRYRYDGWGFLNNHRNRFGRRDGIRNGLGRWILRNWRFGHWFGFFRHGFGDDRGHLFNNGLGSRRGLLYPHWRGGRRRLRYRCRLFNDCQGFLDGRLGIRDGFCNWDGGWFR